MGRVSKFLNEYKNWNSFRNNRTALKCFFAFIYGESSIDLDALDGQAERYFSEERDFEADVSGFLGSLDGEAPKTIRAKISGVRCWLVENKVELGTIFWRRIRRRIKGSRARTIDKIPTPAELRKLLMHLPIQGQALTLTLESSGMRIGESLKITEDDLDLDADPCKIQVRGEITKTGDPRITFISSEAKERVQEWLTVKQAYINSAVKKSHWHVKQANDPRVFPFADVTFYLMWTKALKNAGLYKRDSSTKRATLHPHSLRKFFRAKLGLVIPVDVVEALMGHGEYLTEVYRKYPDPEKTLREYYVKGANSLLVFSDAQNLTEMQQQLEEQKSQTQQIINSIVVENMALKQESKELKDRLKRLEEAFKSLRELIEKGEE